MIRTGIFFIKRINDILFRFLAGSRIYRQNDRNINLFFFCAPACLPRIFTTSGQHCQNQCDTKHRLQIFSINHVSPFRHPEFGLYTGFHFLLPHSKTAHPLHISAAVWYIHHSISVFLILEAFFRLQNRMPV